MLRIMKKNKLAVFSEVSQIISALAVIVSLIYVGAQVNQNTKTNTLHDQLL